MEPKSYIEQQLEVLLATLEFMEQCKNVRNNRVSHAPPILYMQLLYNQQENSQL